MTSKNTSFVVPFIKHLACTALVLVASFQASIAQQSKQNYIPVIKANYTSFTSKQSSVSIEDWKKYNAQSVHHSDFAKVSPLAPKEHLIELLAERNEFEKHFLNPNNPSEIYVQKSFKPLHFKSANEWKTIDHRLERIGASMYEASSQLEPVGFDVAKNESYIKTKTGKISFNKWVLIGIDDMGKEHVIGNANWSNLNVGENGILVRNAFDGIDLEMKASLASVKTNFIIKEHKFKSYKQLVFRDEFKANEACVLNFKKGQSGSVYVSNKGNKSLLISKGYAYVQKYTDIHTDLEYQLNDQYLGVVVEKSFIEKYIAEGPIVVDPLVSGTATLSGSGVGSMYNSSCTYTNACTYSITVPTPSGTTFTDVLWTMGFTATNPCGMTNAWFTITSSTCITPFAGGAWTCLVPGPGTCAGVNMPGMSNFSSCLPAPSCSSTNLTYNLNFYRGCVGPAGCDDGCIAMAIDYPFTVTIQGKTVEHTNKVVKSIIKDSVCQSSTVIFSKKTSKGVAPYGTTVWSLNRSGTPVLASGDSLTKAFLNAGTYWVYAKTTDACNNIALDSQKIYVDSVWAPISSDTINYCLGLPSVSLSASKRFPTDTVLWYTAATGGTPSLIAPIPTTTSAGTTTYYVSQKSYLGCESNRKPITVIVNPKPSAPVVPSTPVVYCQTLPASALSATGTSLLWYTSATMGTGSTTAPTPSTASSGSTVYYVSQTSGFGCESDRASITVNVNPKPSAPIVSSTPIVYCQTLSSSALSATGTSLLWYTSATMGTGSTTAPTPSTASSGSTVYYVSQTNSFGCESDRSSITVNVNPKPSAPVVPSTPIVYCQTLSSSALSATGTSLLWYTSATMGTGSTTAPTPSTASSGSTVYYVSQTNSFGCESDRASITVNVNPKPSAPIVPSTPVVYCQTLPASALSATGTSLLWYTSATMGTGSITAPTPSTASSGSTVYYVSQTSGFGCESDRASITVNVNPKPSAPIVPSTPIVYCQTLSSSALSATGTSLLWYTSATMGTGSTTAPTPSTASSGSTVYYVSQTNSFGCESDRSSITVNVNPKPSAPVVPSTPIVYCQTLSSSALSATGTSLLWYTSATMGTGSTTAPTPSTASSGSTVYYVSQTSGFGCESDRASITVNVNPKPSAPVVSTPLNICVGVPALALAATGTSLKWYTTLVGGPGSSVTPIPTSSSVGTGNYYVSQTNGFGCESDRSTITVNVKPSPALSITPVGVPGFVFCDGKLVTMKSNAPTAISFEWQKSGTPILGATLDTFSAGVAGYYQVLVTDMYGCKSIDSVYVSDNKLPLPTLSPVDVKICDGVGIVLYCGTSTTPGYIYEWFKDGISISAPSLTTDKESVYNTGKYTVVVKDIYKCVRTTNESNVFAYPAVPKPKILRFDPILRLDKSYVKYQWYRNNKAIAGATSNSYSMSFDGTYFAEVSDANGCMTYSDTISKNALAINEQSIQASIRLYPNPTNEMVTIESSMELNVMVTDVLGRKLLNLQNPKQVNLKDLASGTYFFSLFDKNQQLISVEKINKID